MSERIHLGNLPNVKSNNQNINNDYVESNVKISINISALDDKFKSNNVT